MELVLRLQVTEIWRPKDANAVMFVWDGTDAKPYASRCGMILTMAMRSGGMAHLQREDLFVPVVTV